MNSDFQAGELTGSPLGCLWAKSDPRHPLWKHLLDVCAVSLALPPPVVDFGWDAKASALIAGLHDVGKADSCFQHQVPGFSAELRAAGFRPTADASCRHERLSGGFVRATLKQHGLDYYVADSVSRILVAHHGHWVETARPVASEYENAQSQLLEMLKQAVGLTELPREICGDLSSFGMRLAGHIVLSDWIASNERFFGDARLQGIDGPSIYLRTAQEVARDWVDNLGLLRHERESASDRIVEKPRPIQDVLLTNEIPPGLVIIEAPMGEGKTEAAWILAEKWRSKGYHGVYMALPTMATSDSLFSRYASDYLGKVSPDEDVSLVHGMAWLRDAKEPDQPLNVGERGGDEQSLATAWFRPTRRAMLASHGVGTVDQAMLAGMNVKFGFLRLYGLADRVLVIDEVHAYDAYMSAIICRLLQWCSCMNIPVIMLSATLSAGQRAAMIEAYGATGGDPGREALYPLITVAQSGSDARPIHALASSSRTLRLRTHSGLLGDEKRTADLAKELVEDGGCCCVILNTVKQAQKVYQELRLPDKNRLLFHARFTAADRERITRRVLDMFGKDISKRPGKFVLVATPVVEQSIDVDFDHMISEIAPIDLLLQRSGRMHRHRTRDYDPTLHVLLPADGTQDFGGTGYVYAEKPLLRSVAILAHRHQAQLPEDFRNLIESCYGSDEWEQDAVSWDDIRQADRDWETESGLMLSQGNQFCLCTPNKRFFRPVNNDPTGDDSDDGNGWRAKTRLGANDCTAVLINEKDVLELQQGELSMRRVRALYRRSLKLPGYLPTHSPAEGYAPGVNAGGRLRGLVLLPLAADKSWQGIDDKGRCYTVTYDTKLGLRAGRAT